MLQVCQIDASFFLAMLILLVMLSFLIQIMLSFVII